MAQGAVHRACDRLLRRRVLLRTSDSRRVALHVYTVFRAPKHYRHESQPPADSSAASLPAGESWDSEHSSAVPGRLPGNAGQPRRQRCRAPVTELEVRANPGLGAEKATVG